MREHPIDKNGTSLRLAVEECIAHIETNPHAIREHLSFSVMSTGVNLLDFTALVLQELINRRQ